MKNLLLKLKKPLGLFDELKQKFPNFKFIQQDVTTNKIEGEFDLIVMIDVIEYIINEYKLTSAMNNIKSCLSDSGTFIVALLRNQKKREFM